MIKEKIKQPVAIFSAIMILGTAGMFLPKSVKAEANPFVGQIMMFAGNFAPRSWAFCDGQLLAISQNDALFSLVGTTYGGDGRTTFALPDLRGRIPVHTGNGPGLTPRLMGQKGGAETVRLTSNQMPSHTHAIGADKDQGNSSTPSGNIPAYDRRSGQYSSQAPDVSMNAASVGSAGGNQAHDNIPPYLAVNYCIALYGIFPSRH